MARNVSLVDVVVALPDRVTAVQCIQAAQQCGHGLLEARFTPETTYSWSEIYLELRRQGYVPAMVATNTGQAPGYVRS